MMKFALLFLSALVAFSDQRFYNHRPPTAAERFFWSPRYYSPRSHFDDYDYQSVNYDGQGDDDGPFYLPITSPAFSQDHNMDRYLNAMQSSNDEEEENNFADVQGRRKTGNGRFPTRKRPSLFKSKPQNDPRFVIDLASPLNLLNRKVKTITFTFTSSLTFTAVTSCIPSDQFSSGLASVTCRRKRRGFIQDPVITPEDSTQFVIAPSDVQPVEPTDVTWFDVQNDGAFNHQLISSKDEDSVDGTSSPENYSREKRFFFHLVTTTTAVSYSFLTTIVTKTVSLLNTFIYPGAYLICLPYGYTVCPYTSNSPIG